MGRLPVSTMFFHSQHSQCADLSEPLHRAIFALSPNAPERIPAKNTGRARKTKEGKKMSVSSVGTTNASAYTQQVNNTKGANDAKETTNASSTKKDQNTAAVYEKSTAKTGYTKKSNSAVVAKMKAEAEQRTSQLQSLVEKMISKQGQTLGHSLQKEISRQIRKPSHRLKRILPLTATGEQSKPPTVFFPSPRHWQAMILTRQRNY